MSSPPRRGARILSALAAAAVFALPPAIDAATGEPQLAYRIVREWLLDQDASPLSAWAQGGRAPLLQVELRQSPPIEDAVLRADKEAQYARCAAEWAAARTAAGQPTVLDGQRGTLLMTVRVGTNGVHAELARPDGTTTVLGALFPSHWKWLPAGIAIVVALLTRRVGWTLAAGCSGYLALALVGPQWSHRSLATGVVGMAAFLLVLSHRRNRTASTPTSA